MNKITGVVLVAVLSLAVGGCRANPDAARRQDQRNPAGNEFGTRQGQRIGIDGQQGQGAGIEPGAMYNQGAAQGGGGNAGFGVGQGVGVGQGGAIGQGGAGAEGGTVGQGVGTMDNQGLGQGRMLYEGGNIGTGQGGGFNEGVAQGVPAAIYRDGTYTGESDKDNNGMERATVTIQNGQITNIDLKRFDAAGNEIGDENVNHGNPGGGGVTANMGQTKGDIANAMLQAQTHEITTSTTGDNEVVKGWKTAAGRALEQARRQ